MVLTRAARTFDIPQMIPTLASCGFDEIVDAAGLVDDHHHHHHHDHNYNYSHKQGRDGGGGAGKKGERRKQVQWLQLYVSTTSNLRARKRFYSLY